MGNHMIMTGMGILRERHRWESVGNWGVPTSGLSVKAMNFQCIAFSNKKNIYTNFKDFSFLIL